LSAGGEGSISPDPVSPVPKLTRIPSPVSGGGCGVENPARMRKPINNMCIIAVPSIPFLLPEAEACRSLCNLVCNYMLLIIYPPYSHSI
jgi:hypothetical protein